MNFIQENYAKIQSKIYCIYANGNNFEVGGQNNVLDWVQESLK